MSHLLLTLLARLRRAAQTGLDRVSDAELLTRFVRDRDAAAFELLFCRHGPMIWGVCRRLLGDSADAEDAYQAAFVVLARKAATIGRGEALAGWLYRVAWRTALNARTVRQRRGSHERPMTDLSDLPGRDDPIRRAVEKELQGLLDQELLRLPEKFRLPVILCDLEAQSNQAAAAALNCPLGTLNSRLARGRMKLRNRLLRRGVTLAGVTAGAGFPSLALRACVAVPPAMSAAALDGSLRTPSDSVQALADGAIKALAMTAVRKVAAGIVLAGVLVAGLAFGAFPGKAPVAHAPASPVAAAFPALADPEAGPRPAAKDVEQQAVVMGKVVDEAGKAVAGATVTAYGWKKSRPVTSGVDGTFQLPLGYPIRDRFRVTVFVQGEDGRLGYVFVSQEKAKPVQVVLKPPHELAVRVTDREDKSVPGAEVYFQAGDGRLVEGLTDADGRWTGHVPADAIWWSVVAQKSKVGFDLALSELAGSNQKKPRPLPALLTLALDGARTLRIKTVDREGKPIRGVKVAPDYIQKPGRKEEIYRGEPPESWPETGEDGTVVFDWLPERFVHQITFEVHSDDYYALNSVSLELEKPSAELTIPLLPQERLSGRVTHKDGRPAAGILVRADGTGAGPNACHTSDRTGADGCYTLKVYSEQAYVVAISDDHWAAPYQAGIVVRAGKAVEGIHFVLGPPTRLHGLVTLGKEGRPVPDTSIVLFIDKGRIPPELQRKGDSFYHGVRMNFWSLTDKDGHYEFHIGPGLYQLGGPIRTETVKVIIPPENPPREIVRDFRMPRPEIGSLTGRVLDKEGRPVSSAVVTGLYASQEARRGFREVKTDEEGRFSVERSLDPLVLHARSPDGKRAGLARLDAEGPRVDIVVSPVATASGRLFDLKGNVLAQTKLNYGIRIYVDLDKRYSTDFFGGTATTDARGRFSIGRLVPGETYQVSLRVDSENRHVTTVEPNDSNPIDLGDLRVDPEPSKPYVPQTPAEQTAEAFAAGRRTSLGERKEKVLAESRREYTRPLLLFGQPKDPACIDLFRLLYEKAEESDAEMDRVGAKRPPDPKDLRWEFDLASLETDQPAVQKLAEELGVTVGKGRPPVLAVLNADGSLAATHPLALDKTQKLDSQALSAFFVKHKLATRDAEQMLVEALRRAKVEDKRVFFIASASWCGPCRLLSRFLASQKKELEHHFVFVKERWRNNFPISWGPVPAKPGSYCASVPKLDISRDEHGDSVRKRFEGDNAGGIPWYAILDAGGKVLITSNAPELKTKDEPGNIGYPSSTAGIEHFLKMLQQTAPRLSADQLAELRQALIKPK